MSVTKSLLLTLLISNLSSAVLQSMENQSKIDSTQIIIAERQQDRWQCGYRAVFNAWLIKSSRYNNEELNLQDPLPSFNEWINRLIKIWKEIFGDLRPFMNGKWGKNSSQILPSWHFNHTLDTRSLSTNDIKLLLLISNCINDPLHKQFVKEYVNNYESFRPYRHLI